MNNDHIEGLSSDAWATFLAADLLPWVLDNELDLGSTVLEIGPGPGRTTDILSARFSHLTAVEVDAGLAAQLSTRFRDSNVSVHHADAADMPFDAASFSGACCFIMLHHVPTQEHQDRLFAEVRRVLAPRALFVGADAVHSVDLAARHVDDTYNPVDATTLSARLVNAGFVDVEVHERPGLLKFMGRVPA